MANPEARTTPYKVICKPTFNSVLTKILPANRQKFICLAGFPIIYPKYVLVNLISVSY